MKDKLLHFSCCLIVSAVMAAINGCYGLLISGWINSFACGLFVGIGKEYGDSVAKGNKWDWKDIAADAIGAAIGATTILIYYYVFRHA